MTPVEVQPGVGPIVLGMPHGGTWLPDAVAARLNPTGRALADTDWQIAQLYDGLLADATVVRATFHRYLIDANRPPDGASLYPGQHTTALCPVTDFDGRPIWQDRQAPGADEIAERTARYHAPYHQALAAEMARVKARHGVVLLYDCHSIRSEIPYLFAGRLPVFNIGTNGGMSCAPALAALAQEVCAAAAGFDHVVDGRFKGGWTTRHYGRPAEGEHALQMELAQRAYLEEAPPWIYQPARANRLRPHLRALLERARRWLIEREQGHG